MGKDGGFIGERRFSCDAASAHVLLNHRFPYLGGVAVLHACMFDFYARPMSVKLLFQDIFNTCYRFYVVGGGAVYMVALRFLGAVNVNDIRLVRNLFGRKATVITNIVEKLLV